jgi:type III pantothenate kinase
LPSLKTSLLAIDVGNTATNFGLFHETGKGSRPSPYRVWTMSTSDLKKKSLLQASLKNKTFSDVVVSSVVPSVDRALAQGLKSKSPHSVFFVSGTNQARVKVLYRRPSEVGADRIVNARAAIEIVRGPSIVVDFGTATTFDCVTARGEYLGGVIAPGPVISAEALYQRTAKLPRVVLKKTADILGRTTLESIEAGLYHGYRGLVREIVLQLKKKMGQNVRVLSTGGQAHWILKGLDIIDDNIPHLTLMGLYYIWQDEKKLREES